MEPNVCHCQLYCIDVLSQSVLMFVSQCHPLCTLEQSTWKPTHGPCINNVQKNVFEYNRCITSHHWSYQLVRGLSSLLNDSYRSVLAIVEYLIYSTAL